ncbi:HNH endonuclease [Mycolicibacterium gadium]|nr:HNH endonuclease signature motif containing protein [Mycolicibacterium gadium]
MPKSLINRFAGQCAYCGAPVSKPIEEHLVPMNRVSVGLHAWGNVVPACKPCNDAKADNAWASHPRLDNDRRAMIQAYIDEFGYAPVVDELRVVIEKLYELADRQTRALIEFGLIASQPYIAGLHASPPGSRENRIG